MNIQSSMLFPITQPNGIKHSQSRVSHLTSKAVPQQDSIRFGNTSYEDLVQNVRSQEIALAAALRMVDPVEGIQGVHSALTQKNAKVDLDETVPYVPIDEKLSFISGSLQSYKDSISQLLNHLTASKALNKKLANHLDKLLKQTGTTQQSAEDWHDPESTSVPAILSGYSFLASRLRIIFERMVGSDTAKNETEEFVHVAAHLTNRQKNYLKGFHKEASTLPRTAIEKLIDKIKGI